MVNLTVLIQTSSVLAQIQVSAKKGVLEEEHALIINVNARLDGEVLIVLKDCL